MIVAEGQTPNAISIIEMNGKNVRLYLYGDVDAYELINSFVDNGVPVDYVNQDYNVSEVIFTETPSSVSVSKSVPEMIDGWQVIADDNVVPEGIAIGAIIGILAFGLLGSKGAKKWLGK